MLVTAVEFLPASPPVATDRRLRGREDVKDVLLTVPHGADGNDVLAPDTGTAMLRQFLNDGFDTLLLLSRTCRYRVVDMNRPASRGTPFRRAVAEELARRPRLLIDVHSFPDAYRPYTGNDIVLLHAPGVTDFEFLRSYALKLLLAAQAMGRRVKVAVKPQGSLPKERGVVPPLDILSQARELGQPADSLMLAEHNESSNPAMFGELHRRAVKALAKERGWLDGVSWR